MVLMIFVNDLWSLTDIPQWLGHVERGVDGMGLADTIFPAFLFIVGMSLPFAIENRLKRGDFRGQVFRHVLVRTIALLIMGVFLVNGESIYAAAMPIPRWLWNPLCCLAFICIWNHYSPNAPTALVYGLRGLGIVALFALAFVYRGGTPGALSYFSPKWWGILGLIGWSYLASALIVIAARNDPRMLLGGWLIFVTLSLVSSAGLLPQIIHIVLPEPIAGGTLPALTMSGVLTTLTLRYYKKSEKPIRMAQVFAAAIGGLVVLTVMTRPLWGISKLAATPAWLFICSAITLTAFLGIYWLVDVNTKGRWFDIIKPAGTDTLLCYLMPYLVYACFRLVDFQFPTVLLVGGVGLVKSVALAFVCVWLTHALNRLGVRLRL